MKAIKLFMTAAAVIVLAAACNSVYDDLSFAQVDPLQKVLMESSYFPEFDRVLDYAAGESATFQFVVKSSKPITDLKFSVTGLEGAHGGFIGYVKEARQTPERASDALIAMSSYYPDPIYEDEVLANVQRDCAQPVWFTVEIPKNAAPGIYEGEFTLTGKCAGKSFRFTKPVSYNVCNVVLEEPSLWVANWFNMDPSNMARISGAQNLDKSSDEYLELVRLLAKRLAYAHNNAIRLDIFGLIDFKIDGKNYSFDFTNFDKVASIFREEGTLKMLQGTHVAGREGLWDSQFAMNVPVENNGKVVIRKFRVETPEAQNFYRQFMPALLKHLKEKNMAQEYVQYIADEPTEFNIGSYMAIAKFIKSLAPEIRTCDACHSHDLVGALDIWVPQLNFYEEGYDFYCDRQKKGDEVWFYTCLAPRGDSPNRFVEQPLLKTRLIHWLNFRYGATGYLHWGFNYWSSIPKFGYSDDISGVITESGNILPAGDCFIIYPKDGKLHGSMRLEAMRDGIADYTLLEMYARKDPEAAKELCRRVTYGWQKFDMSSEHFYDTRSTILKALSQN